MLIVGGGLAGGLLALALRERGVDVSLIAGQQSSATEWSYGVIPGWPLGTSELAIRSAKAPGLWRDLQRRYGDLGWSSARIHLHGGKPWARLLPLPGSQVDTGRFHSRLPELLQQAGVRYVSAEVLSLERQQGEWLVRCSDDSAHCSPQLVLAAGAGSRILWPAWPEALRSSWAGVLELPEAPVHGLRLPAQFQRPALERSSAELQAPRTVVDAGLVPRGAGALLGQISSFAPGLSLQAPPPALEQELRQAIAASGLPKGLAEAPGRWHQVPVAFSRTGSPLAGPLADAPGLFGFSGFSGGFAQVPLLAPLLAEVLAAGSATAQGQLERLQVWQHSR